MPNPRCECGARMEYHHSERHDTGMATVITMHYMCYICLRRYFPDSYEPMYSRRTAPADDTEIISKTECGA